MKPMYKKKIIFLAGVLALCMIIGSFYDYAISSAILNIESGFSKFFASYGQLPMSVAMSVSGMLLIISVNHQAKRQLVLSYFFGAILIGFSFMMVVVDPYLYMKDVPLWLTGGFGIVLLIIINVIFYQLLKDVEAAKLRKFICFLIFVSFTSLIIINLVKIPWGRPRMRMIDITKDASFQPWWVIGSSQKDHLMALGVASEEFKSFPSGHTANAALSMILCVLPLVRADLSKYHQAFFWGAFIFTFVVAFSRVMMGAHFLSDVTMGCTVTLLVILLGKKLFFKEEMKEDLT